MATVTTEYRNVSNVTVEVHIGDKRLWLEPGKFIKINETDKEKNATLLESNYMLEIKAKAKKPVATTTTGGDKSV